MTSIVSPVIINTIASNTYDVLSATLGIVVMMLALALLFEKELWRVYSKVPAKEDLWTFDALIVPLLIPFAIIIGMRFVEILLTVR